MSRSVNSSIRPGASPLPPQMSVNTQTKVIDSVHGRILCIADVRGKLSSLNDMAREANAKAIIHTGDFGFFEASSIDSITDRSLKYLMQYSPLIPNAQRNSLLAQDTTPAAIRAAMNISLLSEFPLLLSGQIKLSVPVFTIWGACEDLKILEKFRQGEYEIENLHVIDEATTRCLDIGGVKLRLLGLGGAFVPHKLFDNGDGYATIAGGGGTMWTTALQIGELVDTAQRVYDPSETRLLVTHASPGREGIIAQLALVVKADLTISAGLHFRYTSSWNEFSVQTDFEGYRHKILAGKESFNKVWESVKPQVEAIVDENQRILLEKALSVVERVPAVQPHIGPGGTATGDEPAWKNCWNWNLCDATNGSLVLDIKEGRVSCELKSLGFNYAYRRSVNTAATPQSATSALPNNAAPSTSGTPAPRKAPALRSNGPSVAPTPPPQAPNQQQAASTAPSAKQSPKLTSGRESLTSPTPTDGGKGGPGKKDFKKKDFKKDKEGEEGIGAGPSTSESKPTGSQPSAPPSGKATPAPEDASTNPTSPTGVTSPGGRETPKKRNPWTIFMRFQGQRSEEEIKEFYGEAKIKKIHFTQHYGKPTRTVFVEFDSEDQMKQALGKHAEKFSDGVIPHVTQADDRDGGHGGMRGRGRGRGGGFAVRGFAAAGLTRQQAQAQGDKKQNE